MNTTLLNVWMPVNGYAFLNPSGKPTQDGSSEQGFRVQTKKRTPVLPVVESVLMTCCLVSRSIVMLHHDLYSRGVAFFAL